MTNDYIKKSDVELVLRKLKTGYRLVKEKCAIDGCILEIRNMPSVDVISRGLFEQYKWERDVAIGQLEELGIGFGEKIDGIYLTKEKYDKLLGWAMTDVDDYYDDEYCV